MQRIQNVNFVSLWYPSVTASYLQLTFNLGCFHSIPMCSSPKPHKIARIFLKSTLQLPVVPPKPVPLRGLLQANVSSAISNVTCLPLLILSLWVNFNILIIFQHTFPCWSMAWLISKKKHAEIEKQDRCLGDPQAGKAETVPLTGAQPNQFHSLSSKQCLF